MSHVFSGSSSLASTLVSNGLTPEVWALYSSGEIFKGDSFVYAMFFLGATLATIIMDYEDRQFRRIAWDHALIEEQHAA